MTGRDTDPSPDVAGDVLFGDIAELIEQARVRAAAAVNTELVMLFWSIGRRVHEDVLGGERAAYGMDVLKSLAARLTERYGRGFGRRNLSRMVRFAELYPESEIWPPVAAKLTWTNIGELLTISEQTKRDSCLVADSTTLSVPGKRAAPSRANATSPADRPPAGLAQRLL